MGIVTPPGAVSCAELSDTATVVAPCAGLFSVAVQVELWPLVSEPGAQLTLDNAGGVVKVRVAVCVPPLRLAVITAVPSAVTLVTFAVNCALVWPFETMTLPGTVTFALLTDRPTVVFEVAAATRLTVQVEDPPELKLTGEQLKPLNPPGAMRLI